MISRRTTIPQYLICNDRYYLRYICMYYYSYIVSSDCQLDSAIIPTFSTFYLIYVLLKCNNSSTNSTFQSQVYFWSPRRKIINILKLLVLETTAIMHTSLNARLLSSVLISLKYSGYYLHKNVYLYLL
jgi:hypothetical protein